MRIDADKLATKGLKLSFDTGALRRRIELGPSGAVTGYYEWSAVRHRIRAGASHALTLLSLDWDTEAWGVSVTSHAKLSGVQVDLTIQPSKGTTRGTIKASKVTLAALELRVAALGPRPVVVDGVELEGLRITLGPKGPKVEVDRVRIGELCASRGPIEIRVAGVELSEGLRLRGASVQIEQLTVAALGLQIDDLQALVPERRAGSSKGQLPAVSALRWLDQLDGRIEVDATVDALIKVLGRRVATHAVRLPIRGGTIDFKRLEKSLAPLEDSVLDFLVEDGQLELVRDVPLVPFDRAPIVTWPLGAEELKLARRNRVRLRRLLDYRLAGSSAKSKDEGEPAVQLRAVDLDDIAVGLKLGGPGQLDLGGRGRLRLGSPEQAAIGKLSITGALRYAPARRRRPKPTSLSILLERLLLGLERLELSGHRVDVGAIGLGRLSIPTLSLRGLVPGPIVATAARLTLSGIGLRPVRARSAG